MRIENNTELRFTNLHAEKARNKFSFASWSKKLRANQMVHIAFFICDKTIRPIGNRLSCFSTREAYQCYPN